MHFEVSPLLKINVSSKLIEFKFIATSRTRPISEPDTSSTSVELANPSWCSLKSLGMLRTSNQLIFPTTADFVEQMFTNLTVDKTKHHFDVPEVSNHVWQRCKGPWRFKFALAPTALDIDRVQIAPRQERSNLQRVARVWSRERIEKWFIDGLKHIPGVSLSVFSVSLSLSLGWGFLPAGRAACCRGQHTWLQPKDFQGWVEAL